MTLEPSLHWNTDILLDFIVPAAPYGGCGKLLWGYIEGAGIVTSSEDEVGEAGMTSSSKCLFSLLSIVELLLRCDFQFCNYSFASLHLAPCMAMTASLISRSSP